MLYLASTLRSNLITASSIALLLCKTNKTINKMTNTTKKQKSVNFQVALRSIERKVLNHAISLLRQINRSKIGMILISVLQNQNKISNFLTRRKSENFFTASSLLSHLLACKNNAYSRVTFKTQNITPNN